MAASVPQIPTTTGDLGDKVEWFLREMRRENVSINTQATYGEACRQFVQYLIDHDLPTETEDITSDHVTKWELELATRVGMTTVHNRHRGLQRFFGWYAGHRDDLLTPDEQRVDRWRNPMGRMKPPRLPDQHVRVLTTEQVHALLKACHGKTFEDRRDEAIVRLFLRTGLRRNELAGLRYNPADPGDRDVDLARRRARIGWQTAKGRRERTVVLGNDTDDAVVDAIRLYLEQRKKHAHAREPWLWLGVRGRLTDSGIAQAIRKRGQAAGIEGLHPHDLRHTWRHFADVGGMTLETLMDQGGWLSDKMPRHYARSTASERAIEHASKIKIGDW